MWDKGKRQTINNVSRMAVRTVRERMKDESKEVLERRRYD